MNPKQLWLFIAIVCLGGSAAALYLLSRDSKVMDPEAAGTEESSESPFSEDYQKASALFDKASDAIVHREWDKASGFLKEIIEKYPEEMAGLETFSSMAAETLASLDCLKKRQAKDFLSAYEVVSKNLVAALNAKDIPKLVEMASCAFYVGRFQTDTQMGVYPAEAVPLIVELASDRDWIEADWSTPEFRVLESTKEGDVLFLTFSKDQGGWFWNGFVFDNENLFEKFKWSGSAFVPNDAPR